jgi:hypothetical protein
MISTHYIVISLDNATENEGPSKCAQKGRWDGNRIWQVEYSAVIS